MLSRRNALLLVKPEESRRTVQQMQRPVLNAPLRLLILVLIGWLWLPLTAISELRGNVASVARDSQYVGGAFNTRRSRECTIYEIKDRNGTLIREFVSPSGQVFAIAWKGHFLPQMDHFLGPLFEAFSTAVQARSSKHSWREPLAIHIPELVFESGGRTGWFEGRAYDPSGVPKGFPIQEIW
jgi:hypothetical protein